MAKVEMYYSEWCGFCHRARALLESKGVAWSGIDADMTAGARQEMMARGGGRTVPQDGDGRLDELLGRAEEGGDGNER
jgi:glutaredoxin 3